MFPGGKVRLEQHGGEALARIEKGVLANRTCQNCKAPLDETPTGFCPYCYATNPHLITHLPLHGTTPLTGERAQAILRGRPRGRLGTAGSGNGCLRSRPRGRFGPVGSDPAFL